MMKLQITRPPLSVFLVPPVLLQLSSSCVCAPHAPSSADRGPAGRDRYPLSLPDHPSLEPLCALASRGQVATCHPSAQGRWSRKVSYLCPLWPQPGPRPGEEWPGSTCWTGVGVGLRPLAPARWGPQNQCRSPRCPWVCLAGVSSAAAHGAGRRKALIRLIEIWGPRPALSLTSLGPWLRLDWPPRPEASFIQGSSVRPLRSRPSAQPAAPPCWLRRPLPAARTPAHPPAGPTPACPARSPQIWEIWAPGCLGGQTSWPHLSL